MRLLGVIHWHETGLVVRIAVLMAAGLGLLLEFYNPANVSDNPQDGPSRGAASQVSVRPDPTPDRPAYAAIVQHPLFYPSREPWSPPVMTPVSPQRIAPLAPKPSRPPPRNYALAGVVLSGDSRSALVRHANDTKILILIEGQTLDGWTLREIGQERLRFEADGAFYDLTFLAAAKRVTQ
jgi:hypothetical protein